MDDAVSARRGIARKAQPRRGPLPRSRRPAALAPLVGANYAVVAALVAAVVAAVALAFSGCGYVSTDLPFTAAQRQQVTTLAQRAAAPDTTQAQTAFPGEGEVDVTVTVGWTSQIGIGDVAAEQERVKALCFREQRAVWTSGTPLLRARVVVLGPVQDDYADMILDAHGEALLSATTASTLAWATLTPDLAWGEYDSVWLRANYQPHVVGS